MKAEEVQPAPPEPAFCVFAVAITISNKDELYALLKAAARMTNGHGLELYDLLLAKWKQNGYGSVAL